MKRFVLILCAAMTLTLHARPAHPLRADRILIEKSKRQLTLLDHGIAVRTYKVSLGPSPVGDKQCEGDKRTPEGLYVIDSRNAGSKFHKSLHVSYPNQRDIVEARRRGCRPGGAIMIHGLPRGAGILGAAQRLIDWTAGCIAVTNDEIDEIWKAVPNGVTVEIRP